MDYESFIRDRITELRLQANVSEYQLSHALGHAHGYINSISRGKMLPAMKEFLSICEYFEITPMAFFDTSQKRPALAQTICTKLNSLDEEDLQFVIHLVDKMSVQVRKNDGG